MTSTPLLDSCLKKLYEAQYRTVDDLPGTPEMRKIAEGIRSDTGVTDVPIEAIERWVHVQLLRLRKSGNLGRKTHRRV